MIFESQREFNGYALGVEGVDMSWSRGYYSARTNHIALFDERAVCSQPEKPSFATARSDVAEERRAPDSLLAGLAGSAQDDGMSKQRDPHRLAGINDAKTLHEAAHQLAFNAGLQRRGVTYPLWVSEGLASCFEAAGPGEAFGPGEDNSSRRGRLAVMGTRGAPLETLVCLTRPPTEDVEAVIDVYAQAWGLFHFLFVKRPAELQTYLETLSSAAAESPSESDDDACLHGFNKAFGSLNDVQSEMDQFLWGADRAGVAKISPPALQIGQAGTRTGHTSGN